MGLVQLLPGIGRFWRRPGLVDQMPLGPEEACELPKDAGCTLGSGEECRELWGSYRSAPALYSHVGRQAQHCQII